MIAKSGINRSKFKITLISNIVNFLRNFFLLKSTMGCECTSHFNHDFALFSFHNQVGIYFWHKLIKSFSTNLSVINRSFFFRNTSLSFLLVVSSFSFFFNPAHKIFISITDFDVCMIVKKVMCSFSAKKTNEKASFAVYYPCKISKFCFSHITPNVNDCTVYNKSDLFVQPDRLSPWAPKGDTIVRTLRINKGREENPKRFSRQEIGHKSNRLPVLNSAAARLGQALDILGAFKSNLIEVEIAA